MKRALSGADVAALLGLEPLPGEGGLFRQTFADAASTAIYYLLVAPEVSHLHRLPTPEVWHHYAGAPARMLLLHPGGRVEEPVLGAELERGYRPQVVVPGAVWQGCEPMGPWSLLGTTMAPPFDPATWEPGDRDVLTAAWREAADRIAALAVPPRSLRPR